MASTNRNPQGGSSAETTTDGAITTTKAEVISKRYINTRFISHFLQSASNYFIHKYLSILSLSVSGQSVDIKTIVYYILVSIPVAFTIFGLGYMIRTNCEIRKKCCKCCVDLEKEDENLDYGAYYYDDGERRQDVVEVDFLLPS